MAILYNTVWYSYGRIVTGYSQSLETASNSMLQILKALGISGPLLNFIIFFLRSTFQQVQIRQPMHTMQCKPVGITIPFLAEFAILI